jgi:hypothetical protein
VCEVCAIFEFLDARSNSASQPANQPTNRERKKKERRQPNKLLLLHLSFHPPESGGMHGM